MKTLIALLTLIVLAGCSILSPTTSFYDSGERLLLAEVAIQAQELQLQCNNPTSIVQLSKKLYHDVSVLKEYEATKSNNDQLSKASNQLYDMVVQFLKMYHSGTVPSADYCRLKLQFISESAQVINKTAGVKE